MAAVLARPTVVALRRAVPADGVRIWKWNDDPEVRSRSLDPTPIPLHTHHQWYAARLADPRTRIWVIEADGTDAGVIRIERPSSDVADLRAGVRAPGRVSIALAATARGLGIGRLAITSACIQDGGPLVAEILPGNLSSVACFRAAGFVPIGHRAHAAHEVQIFEWRSDRVPAT
jgi:L-amino acid N-acyltransferase YncA